MTIERLPTMIKRTLYFGNPAYLSLRNAQLVLRLPEVVKNDTLSAVVKKELERTIPIEDIGVVILDHKQITITQGLLEKLMENNCAVITCDSTRMPAGLLLPLDVHSVQSERFRAQVDSSKPLRKQLWQQTVAAKIANQAAMLHRVEPATEVGNMMAWARAVRSDDAMNLEARAAAYYWRNFFPECEGFVRHREGDAPNHLLNYGYAILRGVIARALVGSGLLPTLGIHHRNKFNAYCLADDIMEPYRPFVDEVVKRMVKKYGLLDDITTEMKRDLLAIPTLDVKIERKRSPLMIAASVTTSSLARCYAGESRLISYPELA